MAEIGAIAAEVVEKKSYVMEKPWWDTDKNSDIKNGGRLTDLERENFWKAVSDFKDNETQEQENPHREVIDGRTHYYDDNEKLYRVENKLEPNTEYEINAYKYKTDDQGRIVSAEGKLHMKERDGRLNVNDTIQDIGKGDQKAGDDRGHIIGDQFDGSNGLENMIPQDANINRNEYRNFENELAKEVKDGKDVNVKIEPIYEGNSKRPEAIAVTYSIDGIESVRIFPNGQGDKNAK